jgi:hypothetical protein
VADRCGTVDGRGCVSRAEWWWIQPRRTQPRAGMWGAGRALLPLLSVDACACVGLCSSVAGKARANAASAAGVRSMAGRWTPEKVPMGPADPILGTPYTLHCTPSSLTNTRIGCFSVFSPPFPMPALGQLCRHLSLSRSLSLALSRSLSLSLGSAHRPSAFL